MRDARLCLLQPAPPASIGIFLKKKTLKPFVFLLTVGVLVLCLIFLCLILLLLLPPRLIHGFDLGVCLVSLRLFATVRLVSLYGRRRRFQVRIVSLFVSYIGPAAAKRGCYSPHLAAVVVLPEWKYFGVVRIIISAGLLGGRGGMGRMVGWFGGRGGFYCAGGKGGVGIIGGLGNLARGNFYIG